MRSVECLIFQSVKGVLIPPISRENDINCAHAGFLDCQKDILVSCFVTVQGASF
jgi:hypothetical protein